MVKCGQRTRLGTPCNWDAATCPHHQRGRPRDEAAPPGPDVDGTPAVEAPPETIGRRDLRGLGWWTLDVLVRGDLKPQQASVVASIMRTLAALGPEQASAEDALREVELRGLLMHGIPPRDPSEWALAAKLFSAEALAEFARWQPLVGGPGGTAPDDVPPEAPDAAT